MELLPTIWFIAIAVLWTGYLFLEGFDLGVGMLMKLFARNNTERRVLLNTIGPVWDGNEVWLLTAGRRHLRRLPALVRLAVLRPVPPAAGGAGGTDLPRRGVRVPRQGGHRPLARTLGLGHSPGLLRCRLRGRRRPGADHHRPAAERQRRPRRRPVRLVQRIRASSAGSPWSAFSLLHALAFLALKTDGDVRHRARSWFVRPASGPAPAAGRLGRQRPGPGRQAVDAGSRGRRRRGRRSRLVPGPKRQLKARASWRWEFPGPGQRLDLRRRVPRGAALHAQTRRST